MMQATDDVVDLGPIRKEVRVPLAPEAAFRLFTRELGSWWPIASHSIEPERVVAIDFEEREGGRIVERWTDGGADWARITAWDPPRRIVLAWSPTLPPGTPTEVEVTFEPGQGGTTLVRLEHRGWQALGETAIEARASYGTGWEPVLAGYLRAASAGHH